MRVAHVRLAAGGENDVIDAGGCVWRERSFSEFHADSLRGHSIQDQTIRKPAYAGFSVIWAVDLLYAMFGFESLVVAVTSATTTTAFTPTAATITATVTATRPTISARTCFSDIQFPAV